MHAPLLFADLSEAEKSGHRQKLHRCKNIRNHNSAAEPSQNDLHEMSKRIIITVSASGAACAGTSG
jgi:hypothetical protein